MNSFNDARDDYVLDYADWGSVRGDHESGVVGSGPFDPIIRVRVTQNYPLRVPAHRAFYAADSVRLEGDRAFYAADSVRLEGESQIENYYPLYLDDQFW